MSAAGRLGFRILSAPARLDDATLARFRGAASSNVADAMGRFNFMDPGIRARTSRPLLGLAVTVRCRPGDNLMVHKAMEVAGPGDIIVVDTGGNTANAVFGELMCHTAVARGLGGIVVDGAIRDVAGIAQLGLAAFSRSVTPGSCDKDGPGEVNVPVSCGGVVVMPGDVIVGDDDGVAAVPRAAVAEVLANLAALIERERKRVAEIKTGVVFKPDVDETLRRHGVIS
ncbi:MAG: RraA family protein [Gemmatimonadetes bacterium]|nr:RraA family protein [Gemmatimonadota bacterium]